MPSICEFYGIVIYLYFREHNPPHFHAKYNEFEAQISIETLRATWMVASKSYWSGNGMGSAA